MRLMPEPAGFKPTLLLLVVLLLSTADILAGNNQSGRRESRWFISGGTGAALLTTEFTSDFAILTNEFNHAPGMAFHFEAGRRAGNHLETIVRLDAYTLFGKSDLPEFSAIGKHHSLSELIPGEPVEYITQNSSVSFILRYRFRGSNGSHYRHIRFHPFAEAGIGIHSFIADLRYQQPPSDDVSTLIYRKKDGETPFGVALITAGLGARIGKPGRVNTVLQWNAHVVDYGTIDAVHNYIGDERANTKTLIMKVSGGITIPLQKRQAEHPYLPFAR